MASERNGIKYYNSGCWTNSHPTYITIGEQGVQIREYVARTEDCDACEEGSGIAATPSAFLDEKGSAWDYEGIHC
jgi:hypothetical protein